MPETELINNWVFASFSDADQIALRPHLQKVIIAQGDRLNLTGERVQQLYFPVTSAMANVVREPDGHAATAATVGRDGVTGLAAFLADETLGWDVEAYVAGYAWKLDADVVREQQRNSPDLTNSLLRVTHQSQNEAARNALCLSHHLTTNRLARWLLTTQDKTAFQQLPMTQEQLAVLLSVQRTTIVQSIGALKKTGSVGINRGRIVIRDRALLKTRACSCYAARPSTAPTPPAPQVPHAERAEALHEG